MLRILIVEDAPNLRKRLRRLLDREELAYQVAEAADAETATEQLATWAPNLVLLDLAIPARPRSKEPDWRHGRDLLRRLRRTRPQTKTIVLTSHGELARDFLLEEGADDFFAKDDPGLWRQGKLEAQVARQIGHLVCASPAMRRLRDDLLALTSADRVVVLEGAAGTGRRHLASTLHRNSPVAHKELRTVDLSGASAADMTHVLLGTPARAGALSDEAVGNVLLIHGSHASPSAQAALGEVCRQVHDQTLTPPTGRPAPFGGRVMIVLDGTLAERRQRGEIETELYRALYPGVGGVAALLTLPDLQDRAEDVPFLVEHFVREAALGLEKVIASIDPDVTRIVSLASEVTTPAQLRRLIHEAVSRCPGGELLPSHLPVDLPEKYQVLFNDGSGAQQRRISERDLSLYADPQRFQLVVQLERDEHDRLAAGRVVSQGQEVPVEDPRLLRLLLLLMREPGKKVDLKANKRRLGISASEPMKRYLFELRRALNDPVIEKTRSGYFTGHWGEACTFHADVTFALITPLRQQPDVATDSDS